MPTGVIAPTALLAPRSGPRRIDLNDQVYETLRSSVVSGSPAPAGKRLALELISAEKTVGRLDNGQRAGLRELATEALRNHNDTGRRIAAETLVRLGGSA